MYQITYFPRYSNYIKRWIMTFPCGGWIFTCSCCGVGVRPSSSSVTLDFPRISPISSKAMQRKCQCGDRLRMRSSLLGLRTPWWISRPNNCIPWRTKSRPLPLHKIAIFSYKTSDFTDLNTYKILTLTIRHAVWNVNSCRGSSVANPILWLSEFVISFSHFFEYRKP